MAVDYVKRDLFHKRDVLTEISEWFWRDPVKREIDHRLAEVQKMISEIEMKQGVTSVL